MDKQAEVNKIIFYGRPGCPGVPPARRLLEAAGVDYEYIDIYLDSEGRQRVRSINRGYESVPTFVFPDQSTMTEPAPGRLLKKLTLLGYDIPPETARRAYLVGTLTNPIILIILAIIVFAILTFLGIL